MIVVTACTSPIEPPAPRQQCEPGRPLNAPYALPELVESTPTHATIRLVCYLNGHAPPLELRTRIMLLADSAVMEAATDWSNGPMPTLTIERHAEHDRVLLWDVRSDEALSTGLRIVQSAHAIRK